MHTLETLTKQQAAYVQACALAFEWGWMTWDQMIEGWKPWIKLQVSVDGHPELLEGI